LLSPIYYDFSPPKVATFCIFFQIGAALALGAIGVMGRKRFAKRSRVIS
jgi:hypothetical protein